MKCSVCNIQLAGNYLKNLWGEAYCLSHRRVLKECFSCGRLISHRSTGGGVQYTDGRSMCNLCRSSSVETPRESVSAMQDVQAVFRGHGLAVRSRSIPLRLVSGQYQVNYGRRQQTSICGQAVTQLRRRHGRVVARQVSEISILRGLPKEHFCAIAAHEFGHAWLLENGFDGLPLKVEEGLCELLQYIWLRHQGTRAARQRIRLLFEGSDPLYAEGFREAYASWQGRSLGDLLRYVKRYKRLP